MSRAPITTFVVPGGLEKRMYETVGQHNPLWGFPELAELHMPHQAYTKKFPFGAVKVKGFC